MKILIRSFFSLVVILTLFYGVLQYLFPAPCSQVITYSIGTIDERFRLSHDEFLSVIQRAEAAWEDPLGKNLFEYDSSAEFTVNLVYDERQERTDRAQDVLKSLNETSKTQESIKQEYDRAYATYIQAQRAYEKSVNAYEVDAQKLAREIDAANAAGGASPEEYERLQKRQKDVLAQRSELEQEQVRLHALGTKVNSLADSESTVVKTYNEKVNEIHEELGEDREFGQGVYNGKSIIIYQFTNTKDLLLVLEHELGHALGLVHMPSPSSIMYYLFHDKNANQVGPTDEDLVELTGQCKKTSFEIFLERLLKRSTINVLPFINQQ